MAKSADSHTIRSISWRISRSARDQRTETDLGAGLIVTSMAPTAVPFGPQRRMGSPVTGCLPSSSIRIPVRPRTMGPPRANSR